MGPGWPQRKPEWLCTLTRGPESEREYIYQVQFGCVSAQSNEQRHTESDVEIICVERQQSRHDLCLPPLSFAALVGNHLDRIKCSKLRHEHTAYRSEHNLQRSSRLCSDRYYAHR